MIIKKYNLFFKINYNKIKNPQYKKQKHYG